MTAPSPWAWKGQPSQAAKELEEGARVRRRASAGVSTARASGKTLSVRALDTDDRVARGRRMLEGGKL